MIDMGSIRIDMVMMRRRMVMIMMIMKMIDLHFYDDDDQMMISVFSLKMNMRTKCLSVQLQ